MKKQPLSSATPQIWSQLWLKKESSGERSSVLQQHLTPFFTGTHIPRAGAEVACYRSIYQDCVARKNPRVAALLKSRSTRRLLCWWSRHHWTAAGCRCLSPNKVSRNVGDVGVSEYSIVIPGASWVMAVLDGARVNTTQLPWPNVASASLAINVKPWEALHDWSSIWSSDAGSQPRW